MPPQTYTNNFSCWKKQIMCRTPKNFSSTDLRDVNAILTKEKQQKEV